MEFTGTIERIIRPENKPIVTVVIATAEQKPNYYQCCFFVRDGKDFPICKAGDLVYCNVNVTGRKWTDPESGEVSYFTSLNITELVSVKKS